MRAYLNDVRAALTATSTMHADALAQGLQASMDKGIRDVQKQLWLTRKEATRRYMEAMESAEAVAAGVAAGNSLEDLQKQVTGTIQEAVAPARRAILLLGKRMAPVAVIAAIASLLAVAALGEDPLPVDEAPEALFRYDGDFETHVAQYHDSFQVPPEGARLNLNVAPQGTAAGCVDVTFRDPAGAVFFTSKGDCGALGRSWMLSEPGTYSLDVAFAGYTGSLQINADTA